MMGGGVHAHYYKLGFMLLDGNWFQRPAHRSAHE